jgi:hypothetical protein
METPTIGVSNPLTFLRADPTESGFLNFTISFQEENDDETIGYLIFDAHPPCLLRAQW